MFLESEENGLLPGIVPGSGGYLGHEVFMLDSGMACCIERREDLYGDNDSVCSGDSNFIINWRSGAKSWTSRQHCVGVLW
jgi:hypothetical protein